MREGSTASHDLSGGKKGGGRCTTKLGSAMLTSSTDGEIAMTRKALDTSTRFSELTIEGCELLVAERLLWLVSRANI